MNRDEWRRPAPPGAGLSPRGRSVSPRSDRARSAIQMRAISDIVPLPMRARACAQSALRISDALHPHCPRYLLGRTVLAARTLPAVSDGYCVCTALRDRARCAHAGRSLGYVLCARSRCAHGAARRLGSEYRIPCAHTGYAPGQPTRMRNPITCRLRTPPPPTQTFCADTPAHYAQAQQSPRHRLIPPTEHTCAQARVQA